MVKILRLKDYEQKQTLENDLTVLLKKAKRESEKTDFKNIQEGIPITDFQELDKVIKGKIVDFLIDKKMIGAEYFLCSEYITKLLIITIQNPPDSWYAVDYLIESEEKERRASWQKAADVCFLICSIFEKRGDTRMMNYQDYVDMGRSFYDAFFKKTNKEIGRMMSDNYKEMVDVTRSSLALF